MGHRVPHSPLPIDQSEVTYEHGPDSTAVASVARGRTTQLEITDSQAFPGTTRSVWVHEPATASEAPLPVVVFQDGAGFLDPDDEMRAAVVLDNLVASGAIPPTVGVFVDPGDDHRNAEYDAADATYAGFLVDEVLPRVSEVVGSASDRRTAHSAASAAAATRPSPPRGTGRTRSARSSGSRRASRRSRPTTRG